MSEKDTFAGNSKNFCWEEPESSFAEWNIYPWRYITTTALSFFLFFKKMFSKNLRLKFSEVKKWHDSEKHFFFE